MTKKLFLLTILALGFTPSSAQRFMRIWQNGESDRMELQDITYTTDENGKYQLTAEGKTLATADVDSITIVKMVTVTYNGTTATVDLGNSTDITYTVDGAHVTLTNTNTTEEMEVELSGESSDGSFTYVGSYKCKIHLNGLNLTSTRGAAIDIQDGKRIDLILADGTTNTLTDCANGTQKAALYCKGHLEIAGAGSLTVAGNTKHAIGSNEYLLLKKSVGTITVTQAVGDAIHAGQYFQMNGGTLNISGMAGDGIQAEATNNPEDEFNGQLFINGGSITMTVTAADTKGIKSTNEAYIYGGNIDITASGAGSKGIKTDTSLTINESVGTTNINIRATGAKYTDPVTKESSRCMGMNVGTDLTISAGTVTVTNTGAGSKGIKVASTYYAYGGTVSATVEAFKVVKN